MNTRVIVVDDEPLARDRLRRFLEAVPGVEVVAACADGPSAVLAVREERPDAVFLDIQMPGMDGFGVLAELDPKTLPAIVFVTGFDQYAVKAFESRALDYLLKPTSAARVAEALSRVRERSGAKSGDETARGILELLSERGLATGRMTRIPVRTNDGVVFVPTDSVDHVEAAGNYVILHVGKATHILRETMASMEAQLPAMTFTRLSRSAIVNLKRVRELRATATGDHVAVLTDGTTLPVTRSIREVERLLKFA